MNKSFHIWGSVRNPRNNLQLDYVKILVDTGYDADLFLPIYLKNMLYSTDEILKGGKIIPTNLANGYKCDTELFDELVFKFPASDLDTIDFANDEIGCEVLCSTKQDYPAFNPQYDDYNNFSIIAGEEVTMGLPFFGKIMACIDCFNLQIRSCITLGLVIMEQPSPIPNTTTTSDMAQNVLTPPVTAVTPPGSPGVEPVAKKRKIGEVDSKKK